MRALAAFLATLVLVGCGTAPAARPQPQSPPQTASADVAVDYLLTSAAADFHAHPAPYPARVRDVRIGYVTNADGTRQYRLCGAFLPEGGSAEWISFVTIRTSEYEQWLGGQAERFCEVSSMVWIGGDFSSALQSRLDALR